MIKRSREKEINKILKRLTNKARNGKITSDDVYHEIIYNGLPSVKPVVVSDFFGYWQQFFKNDLRINVYVKENDPYFCKFVSRDFLLNKPLTDPIKVYVSLKPKYLYEGANKIFRFLTENNIKHNSKIGMRLRTDSIVIRIYNMNDANQLIGYLNNDFELVKNHNDVSPFCFQNGIVGLAIDNYHSYNDIISNLICQYINDRVGTKQTSSIECYDLCEYLKQYNVINEFNNGRANYIKNKVDIPYVIEVKDLFVKCLSTDNLDEFNKHYYSVMRNQGLIVNKKSSSKMVDDLLIAMKATDDKYGNERSYEALYRYILNGNTNNFTRVGKNGDVCRALLYKYNYREVRQEIVRLAIQDNAITSNINRSFDDLFVNELATYFYNNYYRKKMIKK